MLGGRGVVKQSKPKVKLTFATSIFHTILNKGGTQLTPPNSPFLEAPPPHVPDGQTMAGELGSREHARSGAVRS